MADKPQTKDGYDTGRTRQIVSYCVEIIARLHDLKDDLVLVGGLVPNLLTKDLTIEDDEQHVGTCWRRRQSA